MPAVSLVVCVHQERDLLQRLLQHAAGCYDDLVVVHDGAETARAGENGGPEKQPAINFSELKPDARLPEGYRQPNTPTRPGTIHDLVSSRGGRFYEGPRAFQQEPHWPFAWWQARHDWILRLDVDEFPSKDMERWLCEFRERAEPESTISGFTCIWPLWNGRKVVTGNWPSGRLFLFNKQRVRFFGMVEAVPIPDAGYEPLNLVLRHEPRRKSFGVRNILFRKQAYHWRRVISESLMASPKDLSCWRWTHQNWPNQWEQMRRHPLRTALVRFAELPMRQLVSMLRARQVPRLSACLNPGVHHFMLGLRVQIEKWRQAPEWR